MSAAPAERLSPEVRAVAIVVVVGAMMSILDTTIVNVALESLSLDLNAPLSTIQWVAIGYLLSLATVIPLTGWAAERFGPRRVWMTVVAGFSVQRPVRAGPERGVAHRLPRPAGLCRRHDHAHRDDHAAQTAGTRRVGQVMSVIGVPMLLAPVLGPVIGGLTVTNLSWRWIFLVNVPVGVIGPPLTARFMPAGRSEGRSADGATRLDWKGLLLLSPGLGLLVFGLSEVSTHGSVDASAVVPFVAGVLLITAFAVRAWHSEAPLVDVQLFRERGFSAAGATVSLAGAALFGALLVLPLHYQVARGSPRSRRSCPWRHRASAPRWA